MLEAVICEPVRTPVGGFGGLLRDVPAHELAATVIRAVLDRTGLRPEAVDEVVLGQSYPTMEAPAIGRAAALDAGLAATVTGVQIDRRCGSGLQAVLYAAMQVQTGVSTVVLAGGAESMSNAPFYSTAMRWGARSGPGVLLHDALTRGRVTAGGRNFPVPGGMIETAENLRREYRIPREEQDELAVGSHRRAAAAEAEGRFTDEIVPVTVSGRKGDTLVDRDEHIRPDTSVEALARLRPIMGRDDPDATVTAGNASGQNDGAAVCVVTTPARAAELGLRPLVRLVSWSVAGVPPATMGIGPVPATAAALDTAGLTLADIDLIELNEAFAAQVLAVTREWKLAAADLDRVNVNGSGISLGHPVGATGGRILATLAREMHLRQVRYGLEPCASAAAKASPPCSNGSPDRFPTSAHRRRLRHRRPTGTRTVWIVPLSVGSGTETGTNDWARSDHARRSPAAAQHSRNSTWPSPPPSSHATASPTAGVIASVTVPPRATRRNGPVKTDANQTASCSSAQMPSAVTARRWRPIACRGCGDLRPSCPGRGRYRSRPVSSCR
jgi:acetyl-CoA C-acetyltransferase